MKTDANRKNRLWIFLALHISLMVSSVGGICSKKAANERFFSPRWFLFYGLVLLIMLGYAIVWQQLLKYLPLSVAYANKPVGLAWGMIWGALVFHETITWKMLAGAAIIFAGIYLVVTADG